jgi:hypothetical protein
MSSRASSRRTLGEFFTIEEFDCPDGTDVPREHERAFALWVAVWGDPLRERFGPVRILSGYRTPAYNRRVGGARNSVHRLLTPLPNHDGQPMVAVAADVRPLNGSPAGWARWARARREGSGSLRRHGRGGIGYYPASRFVHLDTSAHRDWSG